MPATEEKVQVMTMNKSNTCIIQPDFPMKLTYLVISKR